MEFLSQCKQYLLPAVVSVVAVGLLKMGLFVTPGDLEQSLRRMETSMRADYATRRDIDDLKLLLNRLDQQISRIDDRLDRMAGRRGDG